MAKFPKGESGNPRGRPKGTSEAAKLRRAIAGDVPDILRTLIQRAKDGDTAAAKLLLDRVAPALKPEALPVEIIGMRRGSLTERATAALDAAAKGDLPPDVAAGLVAAVAAVAKIVETDEIEKRLSALEEASNERTN